MSRVLIVLELGNNYGHLAVCLPVAKALRARGHTVAFVLRDLRLAAERLAPDGFTFLQAPVPQKTTRLSRPPANYPEILLGEGYGDIDDLLGLVGAWRNTFRLLQPDLVLADHAPTALFAARLAGIAHLALGSGFTVPPAQFPMPSIRPWEDILEGRLERSCRAVDDRLAHVARKLGCLYDAGLSGLFGTRTLLTTFAELDCYAPRVDGRYIGPIYDLPDVPSVDWPPSSGERILAYLRTDIAGLSELLAALGEIGANVVCVLPGAKPDLVKQFANSNLKIVANPVNLKVMLQQANLVVSYGGHGVLAESLLVGLPMLVVPQYVEQALNAQCAERLGAAIVVGTRRNKGVFKTALERLLEDGGFAMRARSFADRYVEHTPECAIRMIAEDVEAILNQ